MSFTLTIDTPAWRQHLASVRDAVSGLVPVAKGNGYGFGLPRLSHEAAELGASTLAVGISTEVSVVRTAGWTGDVVVLTPWTPSDSLDLSDPKLIVTIGRISDLSALASTAPHARVIVEVRTSMQRHGVEASELSQVPAALGDLHFEGWTIHLPMIGDSLAQARRLAQAALAVRQAPLWLSHLSEADYRTLASEVGVETHLRMGTKLWLGAPSSRTVTATVLDVHPVAKGQRIGYWQRRMPRAGSVVVVSGGTANGIAMEAPTAAANSRQRLIAAATGSMEALGLALSPYEIEGKKRFFVEPPHMQSSLIFVPGATTVGVGDHVPVEARLTTVSFDAVEG